MPDVLDPEHPVDPPKEHVTLRAAGVRGQAAGGDRRDGQRFETGAPGSRVERLFPPTANAKSPLDT